VVHQCHPAGRVRVGVAFVRRAVGGPAGVTDTHHRVQRLGLEHGLEVAQLAGRAAPLDAAAVDVAGDPGRVVAPVFEAFQALDQAALDGRPAQDADDAAHACRVL